MAPRQSLPTQGRGTTEPPGTTPPGATQTGATQTGATQTGMNAGTTSTANSRTVPGSHEDRADQRLASALG